MRSATSAGAKRGGAVRRRVLLRLASALVLGLVLIALLQVLLLRWIHPVTSAVMVETRIGAWWDGRHDFNLRYQWLDFDDISPYAAVAVVAAEDQKFAEHFGFDVASIESAWEAHEEGRRLRGASTISQQVAKNLFLWPGRSYLRKALEACYTLLLEGLWPKRRILEVYLNIAQFGDGVFGVGAAARLYFHKPALDLTASEAAALAAVLPNPIRFSVRHPSRYVYSRRRWILRQMSNLGGVEWLKDL